MPTEPNDSAYPYTSFNSEGQMNEYAEGCTKREYFAAMAEMPWNAVIQTILGNNQIKEYEITLQMIAEYRAKYKVLEADALINELNKAK